MSHRKPKMSQKRRGKCPGHPRARVKENGTFVPSHSGTGQLSHLSHSPKWDEWLAGASEEEVRRFKELTK
jgi:hypothetical protein